jgi:predicted ribosome quality control (RQC) complex YloA/Tae2 family protein
VTLALLLRKYVQGARLAAITQPPWERILHFDFSGPEGDTRLIAEIMDQRSNLILTLEGEILDSIRRIGPEQNRRRVILPRTPYIAPPPQQKTTPDRVSAAMIADLLAQSPDAPAWRVLVEHIVGVSPLLARETIYRAGDEAEAPAFDLSGEIVYQAFSALMADMSARRWSPCVVPAEDGVSMAAFAAYPIQHLGQAQPVDSISAAMERYFAAPGVAPYGRAKQTVSRQIEAARKRIDRKLAALDREAAQAAQIETLRKQGELLLAYGLTLRPGQMELKAQYDPDGPQMLIPVDPTLTHVENARRYFERYDKAKRAAADLPALIETARREAAYLDQLATDLDLAENWPEIDMAREELVTAGYWQGQRHHVPQSGKPGIRRITTEDGFVILIGRSAEQNHVLVTQGSKPHDLWLHVKDKPGSHAIIRNDGRPIPDSVIRRAAELAAYYSAVRGEASVDVIVTERRYVRPIKAGKPGQVTVKNEQVLRVKPEKGE